MRHQANTKIEALESRLARSDASAETGRADLQKARQDLERAREGERRARDEAAELQHKWILGSLSAEGLYRLSTPAPIEAPQNPENSHA